MKKSNSSFLSFSMNLSKFCLFINFIFLIRDSWEIEDELSLSARAALRETYHSRVPPSSNLRGVSPMRSTRVGAGDTYIMNATVDVSPTRAPNVSHVTRSAADSTRVVSPRRHRSRSPILLPRPSETRLNEERIRGRSQSPKYVQ